MRVLLLPRVERGRTHAQLPADVPGRRARLGLAQGVGDLLFGELRALHGPTLLRGRTAKATASTPVLTCRRFPGRRHLVRSQEGQLEARWAITARRASHFLLVLPSKKVVCFPVRKGILGEAEGPLLADLARGANQGTEGGTAERGTKADAADAELLELRNRERSAAETRDDVDRL